MQRRVSLVAIVGWYTFMCLIWGTTWFGIKISLLYMPPLSGVGLRFVVAGLLLLGVGALRRDLIPLRALPWKLVLVLATCLFGLNYVLTYNAERGLTSGLTAVLFGTLPFFAFFYARYLVDERATSRVWIGTILAFAGVGVISLIGESRGSWPYVLSILGSAALAGFANVYAKRHSHHAPLAILAPAMLIAGIVVGVAGIAIEHPDAHRALLPASLGALLYLSVLGSAVAFFINLWLLKHVAVWVVNFSALIIPVIAVLVGIFFAGEAFSPRELIGAAMVVAGLWFALSTGNRPTALPIE
ncbi:MAG TPA: EamA family transporter [Candidatus Baltobacteraceae bacterium]